MGRTVDGRLLVDAVTVPSFPDAVAQLEAWWDEGAAVLVGVSHLSLLPDRMQARGVGSRLAPAASVVLGQRLPDVWHTESADLDASLSSLRRHVPKSGGAWDFRSADDYTARTLMFALWHVAAIEQTAVVWG
jgi:hypothetical protein